MRLELQLRVLSGCHMGASLPVQGGESLGADTQCDIVLTDFGLDGPLWLHLDARSWGLFEQQESAPSSWPLPPRPWGDVARLGAQHLTVCPQDMPWQQLEQSLQVSAPILEQHAGESEVAVLTQAKQGAAPESAEPLQAEHKSHANGRRLWGVLGLLMVLTAGGLWARSQLVNSLSGHTDVVVERSNAGESLHAVQQALAHIEGTQRLQVQVRPDGQVEVVGWVDSVVQLDGLAHALAMLVPAPLLRVHTLPEVIDELASSMHALGQESAARLDFAVVGLGRIGVKGQVLLQSEHDRIMRQLSEHIPRGIELLDQIRVAQTQDGVLRQWLQQEGFSDVNAVWQATHMKIALSLQQGQRNLLENVLLRKETPLAGIPFVLQANEAAAISASKAPLPFQIRGVVGGDLPYVVLTDGTKLLVGASYKGWHLLEVQDKQLVFDGPRRLVVQR